ncbi:hypothetical protein [Intrasporangium chromatireducens]|nr:hypothetical protein [Intrasporangium chromatireducens]
MPSTGTADEAAERVALEEEFWDVVLSDEEWLRAEFDDVVCSIADATPPTAAPRPRKPLGWPQRATDDRPTAGQRPPRTVARLAVARQRGPPERPSRQSNPT